MTKLEQIKDNEWECILEFINSQIGINKDIINGYRCLDFNDEELEKIKQEQKLLKSCKRKLEKMKGKVLYSYD